MYLCRINFSLFVVAGCLAIGACTTATNRSGFPTDARPIKSNSQAAREANERGLALVEQDKFDLAEEAFRDAIRSDMRYAAAHNNLGLVLLQKRKVYEAATEFQAASKLEPRASEPSINLASLFKKIGWEREAAMQRERTVDVVRPK